MLSQNDLQDIVLQFTHKKLVYIYIYNHILIEYLWRSAKDTWYQSKPLGHFWDVGGWGHREGYCLLYVTWYLEFLTMCMHYIFKNQFHSRFLKILKSRSG